MNWIDDIINKIVTQYKTTDIYELLDSMKIAVIKVNSFDPVLIGDNSIYCKMPTGHKIIFLDESLPNYLKNFYLKHELGHCLLHDHINNFNRHTNKIKLEKEADYFAYKLSCLYFDVAELRNMSLDQICSCLEVPH